MYDLPFAENSHAHPFIFHYFAARLFLFSTYQYCNTIFKFRVFCIIQLSFRFFVSFFCTPRSLPRPSGGHVE
jgi:hypothetical protein